MRNQAFYFANNDDQVIRRIQMAGKNIVTMGDGWRIRTIFVNELRDEMDVVFQTDDGETLCALMAQLDGV